jgi:hypothetical protein
MRDSNELSASTWREPFHPSTHPSPPGAKPFSPIFHPFSSTTSLPHAPFYATRYQQVRGRRRERGRGQEGRRERVRAGASGLSRAHFSAWSRGGREGGSLCSALSREPGLSEEAKPRRREEDAPGELLVHVGVCVCVLAYVPILLMAACVCVCVCVWVCSASRARPTPLFVPFPWLPSTFP